MFYKIFRRVNAVFRDQFSDKNADFISGFMNCFQLFEIGYKETEHYRVVQYYEQKLHEKNKLIAKLRAYEKENIKRKMSFKQRTDLDLLEAFFYLKSDNLRQLPPGEDLSQTGT